MSIQSDFTNDARRTVDFVSELERYTPLRARAVMLRREIRREHEGGGDPIRAQRLAGELDELRAMMEDIERRCDRFIPRGELRDESYFENLRTYLRCRYIDSMTIEEIAEVMDISRDTMYRFKRRAERTLSHQRVIEMQIRDEMRGDFI